MMAPEREVDVTADLVAAISEALRGACGGNDALNRIEAERHLQRLIEGRLTRARDQE
jgi:hypothetical protein